MCRSTGELQQKKKKMNHEFVLSTVIYWPYSFFEIFVLIMYYKFNEKIKNKNTRIRGLREFLLR